MSFANPTPLRLGQTATFAGVRYELVGRGVLGVNEDGETYYWNEFYLVGPEAREATLVYEVSDGAPQWRLFTYFEPGAPLTAAQAAQRRVGNRVSVDGDSFQVTLVGASQVYSLEGQAPEGVEVGDIAHYFNAESATDQIVVSWTRDEVEHYRGMDLTADAVAAAFGIPVGRLPRATPVDSSSFTSPTASPPLGPSIRPYVGLVLAGLAVAFAVFSGVFHSCGRSRPRRATTASAFFPAPAARLAPDRMIALGDHVYRIRTHAVADIACVGLRFQRHEYFLRAADGAQALLIQGFTPAGPDWVLFLPVDPTPNLTGPQAAMVGLGQLVDVGSGSPTARVTRHFQSTIAKISGEFTSGYDAGTRTFGFDAELGGAPFLARWNEGGLTVYRGLPMPDGLITAGLQSTNRP